MPIGASTAVVEVLMRQQELGQNRGLVTWQMPANWAPFTCKDQPRRTDILELAFDSRRLRSICESEAEAKVELGERLAEVLKRRLADLRAATSPNDLVAGRPCVAPDGKHMFLDLCDGHRVVFKANHINNPSSNPSIVDWGSVNRIKIVRIEGENAEH